ncbi:hypothetical protein [uncultured Methylobacterium sp.]|uniref:hypothetical protein n=1 Tax=uncultured Methylobacterium sp. TaxID=157278 RepID=UPI0035C9C932
MIQTQFGIARSTLYRLVEPWGGLGGRIRIHRIDKAAAVILADLDGFRDIKQIAKQDGFSSAPHIGRAFAAGRVPWRGVASSEATTITGRRREDRAARIGRLTRGSSPIGAMLSRVM